MLETAAGGAAMAIDRKRLRESLHAMARIGATERGGVTRLALTDEDRAARDLFRSWLAAARLDVRVDDLGNIYGWRIGTDPSLPPVLVGSHLDTVRHGGQLDGALGTLGALEVARALNDNGIATRRTVGVVAFTAEEGARFEPSILGPSVLTGRFAREFVYSRQARDTGATFEAELERIGYKGDPDNRPPALSAFLELHIEQGPMLAREGLEIGVVDGIVGLTWLEVTLTGQADHSGASPMAGRRDALVGAARVVTAVRDLARTLGDGAIATVGRLAVDPDVINVIPGRVTFSIDLRHADMRRVAEAVAMTRQIVARIAEEEGLEQSVAEVGHLEATRFPAQLVELVEAVARRQGRANRRIVSGAGHDSQWMARYCPTTMIFVPSRDGRSHCEEEATDWPQIVAGVEVLAEAVVRLAQHHGEANG
ncbi:MAG: Zn-dependent hydrolase [Thermomicrobiales bacterium]|nr:Zn-dependent hydrolase [Thermomicrobiales bacterium]